MSSLLRRLLVCPKCHSEFLDPMDNVRIICKSNHSFPLREGMPDLVQQHPGHKLTSEAFGRQWQLQNTHQFESQTIYGESLDEELQSFLSRFELIAVNQLHGKRILDIGCGSGRLTEALARNAPGAEVVGGDLSSSALIAHQRCQNLSNAVVARLDLYEPPFQSSTFDYVYADGVLPHVPDPQRALSVLSGLLRPGGKLFVWIYPTTFSPYRFVRDILVRPWRLPPRVQRGLAWGCALPLWAAFKIYEPFVGPRRRSYRETVFMLHDNIVPEFQHRFEPQTLVREFENLGLTSIKTFEPAVGITGCRS